MSTEDIVHRLATIKLQELLLVSALPKDAKHEERIREIVGSIQQALQQLRTPEEKARDAEYFEQNGGILALSGHTFEQWKSQLMIQEPPAPPSPPQSVASRPTTPGPPLPPSPPPPSQPSLLRLSIAKNKLFLSDLKEAYESLKIALSAESSTPAGLRNSQEIKLKLGQCDVFTPFLVAHVGVYDGQYKYHDVLVAGSRILSIFGIDFQVNALARGIAVAKATNTTNRDYPVVDPRGAAYDALAKLSDDNDSSSLDPKYHDPLAIAAREATNAFNGRGGEKNKAWLMVSKLKGPCKTQAYLLVTTIVQIKTMMLIRVEMWKEKFEGVDSRAGFFKDLEALGIAITGKSILGLSIAGLIEDVLVEGTFRKLSSAHCRTLKQCWHNLNEDMTSKVWLPQYAIAEADSLVLENYHEPWGPPAVTQPILRPYLSKDDSSMGHYRRAAVRSVVYTPRALKVAQILVEAGFPEDRILELALALLCTAPSDLGNSAMYNFLMDDDESIRSDAAQYLRPAGPSKKDKGGPVTKMIITLENKAEKFRNHHIFSNPLNDIERGTTETLDTFTAIFQVLEDLIGSVEVDEVERNETGDNEHAQV